EDGQVAGEPQEIGPVAELPFQVAPAGPPLAAVAERQARAVVGRVDGADVADGPLLDLLTDRPVGVAVAPAEAGQDAELFLRGQLGGLQEGANARGVDGGGAFTEGMLAGGNGGGKVQRMECRRGGDQHDIDAAVDDASVGVEPEKTRLGGDPDLVRN